jgi:hypothetical protein
VIKLGLIWAAVFFAIPGEWTGMFTLTGLTIALVGVVRWYLKERRKIQAEELRKRIRLLEAQNADIDREIADAEASSADSRHAQGRKSVQRRALTSQRFRPGPRDSEATGRSTFSRGPGS